MNMLLRVLQGDCILRYNDLKDNSVTDADDDFSLRSKWRDSEHYKSSSFDVDVSAAQIYKVITLP